jgi:effector-binding domain-containing protein
MKKAQVEQALRDELSRIQSIEDRIKQIEEKGVFSDTDVILKGIPAQYFLSIRKVMPAVRDGFALIHEIHRLLPQREGKNPLGQFAVMFHADGFDTENVDVEMGYLLDHQGFDKLPLSEGRVLTSRHLPAVETMATMVCVGLSHHVSAYGGLGSWIENNNFRLAGPAREVFLEPLQPGKEDEAIIEIQLPVQPLNYSRYQQKGLTYGTH